MSPSVGTAAAQSTLLPTNILKAKPVRLTAYVGIAPTGAVTIVCPQTEIGQGVFDSLARLIAEELELECPHVTVRNPCADAAFVSPIRKRQKIGGNHSVISYYQPLRQAGATVRDLLIGAAAKRWDVPAETCSAAAGCVLHAASKRSLSFGELAEVASTIPVPNTVKLKADKGFFAESFVDELAHCAGKHPYQFRRMLLAQQPRVLAVLDLAAKMAGWGNNLTAGLGRGIVISVGFGSICAQVAEVEKTRNEVHLRRVNCAYDCGKIIDPSTVDAQIEGAIVFGSSGALAGLDIERGSIKQSNFHDYPALRINAMPEIALHRIVSDLPPGGIGETGVPAAAPALANAIFAATG